MFYLFYFTHFDTNSSKIIILVSIQADSNNIIPGSLASAWWCMAVILKNPGSFMLMRYYFNALRGQDGGEKGATGHSHNG